MLVNKISGLLVAGTLLTGCEGKVFDNAEKYMENKLSEDDDSTLCKLIKEKIMTHTKQLNSKTTKTYFSIITISDLY